MAENKDGGEKSEQPTGKKLADARRKGQVPLTRELPPLFVLLGGVGVITLWAPQMLRQFYADYRHWLVQAGTLDIDSSDNSISALLVSAGLQLSPKKQSNAHTNPFFKLCLFLIYRHQTSHFRRRYRPRVLFEKVNHHQRDVLVHLLDELTVQSQSAVVVQNEVG